MARTMRRGVLALSMVLLGGALTPVAANAAEPAGSTPGQVLWDGGVETGGLPRGSVTGGGTTDSQYSSIQQMGGPGTSAIVTERVRTPDSARSLKIVMPPFSQREQPVSTFSWTPDASGSVDHWYGFSLFYDADWELGEGIAGEVSGSDWHNPVAWRMDGDNGSLNLSGDLVDGQPRMMLRRNTVKDREGFYTDGLGLDKIDAGPVVSGRWMDFVVHIRWSTTGQNALREVWRDGVYMGGRTSLNAVAPSRHVLRVGQYQHTNIAHTRTTYYDNVRIGTSYEAVDPSRSAGPSAPAPQPAPVSGPVQQIAPPAESPTEEPAPQLPTTPVVRPVDLGLAACPATVPSTTFTDLGQGTTTRAVVDCAAWWELVRGVSRERFVPDAAVTRGQAASLLARQLAQAGRLSSGTTDAFRDDDGNVHEPAINALARLGVVSGVAPGRFAPDEPLRRDQLATFLVRTQEVVLGPLPTAAHPFTDVLGSSHEADIAKAYAAGLTLGATASTYDPARSLPRRQVAAFLLRATDDLLASGKVRPPS